MEPYYERDGITIYHGDCLDVMPQLAGPFDAVIVDPPYFRVLDDEWDRQWETEEEFIEWICRLLVEFERLLVFNGSLFLFCYWTMAAPVEMAVRERFNVLNNIVWRKSGGTGSRAEKESLRAFLPMTERIIFAEHYGADNAAKGESGWGAKCDELRGFVFEPLRAYLAGEWERAGLTFEDARQAVGCASGSGLPSHWFTCSQWMLPTEEKYYLLRTYANANDHGGDYLRREYEDLRREYEDLRREYEDLRRPFALTNLEQYTDVWEFMTSCNEGSWHSAQKPLALMRHIIRISTRRDAIILDSCMGSGTTLLAARQEGRRAVGIEISEEYCEVAVERLRQQVLWQVVERPAPVEAVAQQMGMGI